MVAIIHTGNSLSRAFHYNENKLETGAASPLLMENYPDSITETDGFLKLKMLNQLAAIRPDVKVNSLHISLNFAPGETLSDDKMREIVKKYMDRIGFGDQPYLAYRHHDSGHPHCHILTTNIEPDGNRISLHHLGRLKSEPARKEIEKAYNLVRAEEHKNKLYILQPVDVQKVQYGKSETKKTIGIVLESVLKNYKYTSLPELNAVLNLYNVSAERGNEDSRIYINRGLNYRVLDAGGDPVGVPIKASLFHNRPTLSYLEKQFDRNKQDRIPYRDQLKTTIDFTLKSKRPQSIKALSEALLKSGIRLVIRENKDGLIYGITYVDHGNKTVFNGSAIGKAYSVKGILERLESADNRQKMEPGNRRQIGIPASSQSKGTNQQSQLLPPSSGEKPVIEELLQHEYTSQQVPYEWRKKKKRKRKR